ncbi:MAG: diguanylate cyclase [Cyanobacteria bacterium P01_E01_bin.6]
MFRQLISVFNRLPLQMVLTLPFVIQVTTVVGIVGYLSFKNGQTAVNNLASQLRNELSARILQELEETVESPYIINQINANSLIRGDIDIISGKGEHQLWQQAKVFPSTNLIYCGSEAEGALLGVGRSNGGLGESLVIQTSNISTNNIFHYYEIDATGNRSFLQSKGSQVFDARIRPWYEAAAAKGGATWSDIYLDFVVQLPTITAAVPVYAETDERLLGVCATDIILSEELNSFLEQLVIGKSGIAFITDPSGTLVATSTSESITTGSGPTTTLLTARDSSNQLIRGVIGHLAITFDGLQNVQSNQLDMVLDGRHHFLEVSRFQDTYGLDWIVVLVVPEADFMEQIHENTRMTLLLCMLAFMITILMGSLISAWLTKPILTLNKTAQELADGHWDEAVELNRVDEIGELSRAFAHMAHQLKDAFSTMERRVEERTNELVLANQELQRLSQMDGLTQVANRRHFDTCIELEWKRLSREQKSLALLICDVDFFKQYNDTYGHQAGDRCLQQVAGALTQCVRRPADVVARYGGEEFAIILPDTDIEGATVLAKQIQERLSRLHIPHISSSRAYVTISIGINGLIPNSKDNLQAFILATDQALYIAKSEGRDCYRVA